MWIIKSLKLCFPLMSRTIICFHVYIILDFSVTYKHAVVFCHSECLHKTVNMAVFFVKSNRYTNPKERALVQMNRVVTQTKRWNWSKGICIWMYMFPLHLRWVCVHIIYYNSNSITYISHKPYFVCTPFLSGTGS